MKLIPLFTSPYPFVFIFSLLHTYITVMLNSTNSELLANTVKGSIYLHIKNRGAKREGKAKEQLILFVDKMRLQEIYLKFGFRNPL